MITETPTVTVYAIEFGPRCAHEKLPPRGTSSIQGCRNRSDIRAVLNRPYTIVNYCRECWESKFKAQWLSHGETLIVTGAK